MANWGDSGNHHEEQHASLNAGQIWNLGGSIIDLTCALSRWENSLCKKEYERVYALDIMQRDFNSSI